MYEANVDDVGYRLVAIYTPIREDGVEGHPVSASTEPITVGKRGSVLFAPIFFFPKLCWFYVRLFFCLYHVFAV